MNELFRTIASSARTDDMEGQFYWLELTDDLDLLTSGGRSEESITSLESEMLFAGTEFPGDPQTKSTSTSFGQFDSKDEFLGLDVILRQAYDYAATEGIDLDVLVDAAAKRFSDDNLTPNQEPITNEELQQIIEHDLEPGA